MKAAFLSIGDELLIGQTVNTNASWLGQECSQFGIQVIRVLAVSDTQAEIVNALDNLLEVADLVLITGGLGPTKDDITKHTLVQYFGTRLVMHEPTLRQIEDFFQRRNRPMLSANIQQAELPESCTILPNPNGTAAGMWFEKKGKIVVSMPGVPYEMKGIMLDHVFPKLSNQFELKNMYHRTIMTQGIGESFLAEKIKAWEDGVRNSGLGLAYLPSPGQVKLRLTSYEGEERRAEINDWFQILLKQIPQFAYTMDEHSLAEVIHKLMVDQHITLGTVESCTAGKLSGEITSVPGSSAYFNGTFVTYSNELKERILGIPSETIAQHGAVSEVVARLMAEAGREKLGVDWCISTTGVAGPSGGTDEKPVGTVFIGVASKGCSWVQSYQFGDNRSRNIQMTVLTALNLLRCKILQITA
jgi:nicotinamide-nucleotide amidase